MPVVAVIPVRGGSKGVPRKNIKPFAGRPLLAWSILAAARAQRVDIIAVSTDDEEIASIARAACVELCGDKPWHIIPQPPDTAQDHSPDIAWFSNFCAAWPEVTGTALPDMVVHLRATFPCRHPQWIDEAIALLQSNPREVDSVRSVVPAPTPPQKIYFLEPLESCPGASTMRPCVLEPSNSEAHNFGRQSLTPTFWHNGCVDVVRPRVLDFTPPSMSGRMLAYVMDPEALHDIDTSAEWEAAERTFMLCFRHALEPSAT